MGKLEEIRQIGKLIHLMVHKPKEDHQLVNNRH
jgi:hypothetical protein